MFSELLYPNKYLVQCNEDTENGILRNNALLVFVSTFISAFLL